MTKAAIIISAILVFAGVAAASSLPGLGIGESDSPTIDTPTLATTTDGTTTGATTTGATTTGATTTNRTTTTGTTTTTGGVDISGPCDEAEHANDPRCTGVPQAGDDRGRDDDGDRHGRNRGPGGGGDDDDNSGHGGDDDNSGSGGGNSGHGGGDDDD